jgi:hypothetical protein
MPQDQYQYIKLPDGSYGKFAANASDADIRAAVQKDFPSSFPAAEPTFTDRLMSTGKDLLKGAGEGALSTISSADEFAQKHLPAFFTTPIGQKPSAENSARATAYAKDLATPVNTTQKIGKGIEQAAEFLAPTGLEEGAAQLGGAALGRGGAIAGRLLGSGIHSGAINKVQGGSFGTGAASGVAGTAIGMGIKAIAPKIAESAIGVRATDRAYKGKNAIGTALLDETTGYTPESVGSSAQKVLDKLNPELENTIAASPNTVSLAGPRKVVADAVDTAAKRGARGSFGQLQPLAEHLDKNIYGFPIASDIPAIDALNLNRGLADDFVGSWNPATLKNVSGTAAQAYHELGEGIKQAVPESRPLYSRISNLIPVEKRASGAALNASTTQKLVHKIGAPTGALVGSIYGAEEGYKKGGIGGGIAGGLGGLILPALATTPTGQIALARVLNSSGAQKAIKSATGLGLQLDRPAKDAEK